MKRQKKFREKPARLNEPQEKLENKAYLQK